MVLTVTLNAAVDKTYRVENFALDGVHRPSEQQVVAGGKGINVARVYRALGGHAVATGFIGGSNGRFIADSLKREGIESSFVRTREESRLCIAVVDPVSRTQTEVNEVGPNVSASEIRALKLRLARLLGGAAYSFVILSGSLPPGVPHGIYAELIGIARRAGVPCVLDASGEALRQGLAARPWMVKPNVAELSYLAGTELIEREAVVAAAETIRGTGVEVVAVTLGRHGAICVTANSPLPELGEGPGVRASVRALQARPPEISFVSAVGSGDAFLAAFVWSVEQGRAMPETLMLATGAGAANAEVSGAGFIAREDIHNLAERVEVGEIT